MVPIAVSFPLRRAEIGEEGPADRGPSSGAAVRTAFSEVPVIRAWKRSKRLSVSARVFPLTFSVIIEAEAVEIEHPLPTKATSLRRSPRRST